MSSVYPTSTGDKLLESLRITGKRVSGQSSQDAFLTLFTEAIELTKTVIDPACPAGQILLATLLDNLAWKLGNNHPAFHKLRAEAFRLNPPQE